MFAKEEQVSFPGRLETSRVSSREKDEQNERNPHNDEELDELDWSFQFEEDSVWAMLQGCISSWRVKCAWRWWNLDRFNCFSQFSVAGTFCVTARKSCYLKESWKQIRLRNPQGKGILWLKQSRTVGEALGTSTERHSPISHKTLLSLHDSTSWNEILSIRILSLYTERWRKTFSSRFRVSFQAKPFSCLHLTHSSVDFIWSNRLLIPSPWHGRDFHFTQNKTLFRSRQLFCSSVDVFVRSKNLSQLLAASRYWISTFSVTMRVIIRIKINLSPHTRMPVD